jgi:FkbM family methyltransferase
VKTFHHGGRFGDLFYALWTMRELGGGKLIVSDYHRPNWSLDMARTLESFLRYQPYIQDVEFMHYRDVPVVDYNLQTAEDDFNPEAFPECPGLDRNHWPGNINIAKRYAVHFGLTYRPGEKWLEAPVVEGWAPPVVIHAKDSRMVRPVNEWDRVICNSSIMSYLLPDGGDWMDTAKVINGSKLFLGVVSGPHALAEGLGKRRFVEQAPDCFNVSVLPPSVCINDWSVKSVIWEVKQALMEPKKPADDKDLIAWADHIEALDRVKVGDFLKQGYEIRGLVHVGANDGYEVQWYRKLGIDPVLCFEPTEGAYKRFQDRYGNDKAVTCLNSGLGNITGMLDILVMGEDGKDDGGSSFLPELEWLPHGFSIPSTTHTAHARMDRWGAMTGIDKAAYNCCVIDVQGMELDVVRGMDEDIQLFDLFIIECSSKPAYKGGAWGDEVVAYMSRMGFDQTTPMCTHDDVYFVKRGLRKTEALNVVKEMPKGNKLNAGSGQRPFDQKQGWINLDISDKEKPDIVGDWNDLTMFDDNSMDIVVSHHSLEHVGCNEGFSFLCHAFRILKPGGSLMVFVPDIRALAQRFLTGQIETQIYTTNIYGPFDGTDGSRHKWGYDRESLRKFLSQAGWTSIKPFDWRVVPGADFARDWHVLALECVK